MRKTLYALSVLVGMAYAQEAPKQPAAEDLLPVTAAVRDYYRAAAQAQQAEAALTSARERAQALQAALEAKFGCKLNLDTNVCQPAPKADAKEQK